MNRQKHVFDTSEIPHLWAHKTQADARNAQGNLYFTDDTIYSYGSHFPIAKHVTNGKGSAILMTTRTYSSTTTGHCSAVRGAIPASMQVFHVPYLYGDLKANVADYIKRIESAIVTSARARSSWRKESSHGEAVTLLTEVKAYATFFKVKLPKLPTVPAINSRAMKAIREREAKSAAKKAEETRLQRERQAEFERTKVERWRNGENVGSLWNIPVMLRIRTFGADESAAGEVGRVETSLGVQIPISHAIRGLRFVRAVVARGEAYQRNGHTLHLSHYAIDKVDADGTLHAGCHIISYTEIERIAPELEHYAG